MMMPPLDTWSTPELYAQIMRLLDRAVVDEDRQPELDAQFEDIYDALSDSDFRDHFGVIDAAINAHLALIDGVAARGAVLDVLLQEYETRFRAAVMRRGGGCCPQANAS